MNKSIITINTKKYEKEVLQKAMKELERKVKRKLSGKKCCDCKKPAKVDLQGGKLRVATCCEKFGSEMNRLVH